MKVDEMRRRAVLAAGVASLWWRPAIAGQAEDYAEALEADDRGDLATAVGLMAPLAARGYARAQVALGTLYANGRGVPLDLVEAYKWLSLGVANLTPGSARDNALDYRAGVAGRMTAEQIAEAERLAAAWTAK